VLDVHFCRLQWARKAHPPAKSAGRVGQPLFCESKEGVGHPVLLKDGSKKSSNPLEETAVLVLLLRRRRLNHGIEMNLPGR
jgi:hypothetical protein